MQGKALPVKPSRIIAGQEPEKTNEFLQAIARAAQKKVYFTRALTATILVL